VSDAPYRELLAFAEREHELVLQEDVAALELLATARDALVASLPDVPPPSARPLLVEADRIQALTTEALQAARTRVAGEMAALERTSLTAAGYSRATGAPRDGQTITFAA
jgi:hypothetical protein